MQFRYRFRIESTGAGQAMLARTFGVRRAVEVADDPVRDMTDVFTARCQGLLGRRSASRWAAAAQAGLEDPP